MIRAAWQGVAAGRAVWWAPALVAAIASTLLGLCLVQTSSTDLPEARAVILASGFELEDVAAVGASIEMIVIPASLLVLALVASAALGQLTVDLARWRIAGASPSSLAVLVLVQLSIVALAGGICGAVITAAVGGPVTRTLNALIVPELAHVAVLPRAGTLLATVLIPVVIALLAGVLPARRAARVSAVRAVVGDEEAVPRVGVLRWTGTVAGAVALVAVTWAGYGSSSGDITIGLGIGVMVLVAAGLGARVLVPLLLAGWTRVLPVRSAVWELARAGAVARSRVSGSTIVALACGSGLLGILAGLGRSSEALERALGSASTYDYLDMYVICAVIGVMSAVGGICVLALNGSDRRREVALLRAAGMTPRQITALAAGEAVALAGTSILIALVASVLASGIVPWAASRAQLPVRLVLPWAELSIAAGITLAVVLAALLVPARRALRASVRETLASV